MSSFFRLYRGSVIRKLQYYYGPAILEHPGFECMIELLLKMIFLKITISEVPMLLDASHRKGKSKMKILQTTYGYIQVYLRKKHYYPGNVCSSLLYSSALSGTDINNTSIAQPRRRWLVLVNTVGNFYIKPIMLYMIILLYVTTISGCYKK